MADVVKVSKARIVYYKSNDRFRAAIVTKVLTDELVNLHIFSEDMAPDQKLENVPFGDVEGGWSWPQEMIAKYPEEVL